jgi:hypothetical protein
LVTPFGASLISFDTPEHRWVPVLSQMVSPDGLTWLYGTLRLGNEYHAVNVRTGTDITLAGSDLLMKVIGLDDQFAYATLSDSSRATFWRLPLDGSPASQVNAAGTWQLVNRTSAWGVGAASLPEGAPYSLQRLNLKTGTVTQWVQLPGAGRVVGFDVAGLPILQVNGPTGDVIVVPSPGVKQVVATAFSFTEPTVRPAQPSSFSEPPSIYEPFHALGDTHGIWLSGVDGIYLSVGGRASKTSTVIAFAAGPCS